VRSTQFAPLSATVHRLHDLFAKSGHIAALASREGCRMSKRSMLGLFELNGRGRPTLAAALPGRAP
jgi:hypothetical protein